MMQAIMRFLRPPGAVPYEQEQQARLLHVMLLCTTVVALVFGIQNIVWNDIPSVIALLGLAGICILALYLNNQLHFRPAAWIFCAAALVVITFTLAAGGASLHDPGIIAYSVFILCAAFLFGRRGLVIATLLSIASVATIYLLEANQITRPHILSNPTRVTGISFLLILMALVTAIVRETWESHLSKLRESYDLTLQGWSKALEYRDGETEGHSRRVTEVAMALAKKMGCSEEELVQIQRGALLHDIGKMALPDRILYKPGLLDEEEIQIVKQHPGLALKLISEIPFLRPAIDIPFSHHEHWDGSGYPRGLKGEEIPLAARIFTVADHWDALSSDRPYRKAWEREKVVAHLRENAGKIYDPRIVQAFLTSLGE